MFGLFRALRRRQLLQRPFPEAWRPIVEERLPFASRLPEEERARFLNHLKLFAWTKHFEGVQGLELTDEIKVVISGCAARLARNLEYDVYDDLTEVVVYPSHYQHEDKEAVVFGEAHTWGIIVLSWDAVRHGLANPNDGHDTALHELAHVLDKHGGFFDGTPALHENRDYRAWARAFSSRFLELREAPHRSVLRDYAATNEAEFFAVATETFFEKPEQLARDMPDLYAELSHYYRLDPAQRRQAQRRG